MTIQPPFWRLHIIETLPSTSDLCRSRAEAGEAEGLAILAREQTAARGTQGRSWSALRGNLFLSFLLRPSGPIQQAPQWGLLTAVAVVETVAEFGAAARLKWPNDVLLGGAKLAGILTEAAAAADGSVSWIVIGIGANLRVAPVLPDRPTACLGDAAPSPEAFATSLLARLTHWRERVLIDGFAPMRAAWLEYGPAAGTPLRVRQGTRVRDGDFVGLTEDGALLLRTDAGVRVLVTGET